MNWGKILLWAGAITLVSLMLCSGYRAIVQVYDLTLTAEPSPAGTGVDLAVAVVTSGRTTVDLSVVLSQAARRDTLARFQVPGNYDARSIPVPDARGLPCRSPATCSAGLSRDPPRWWPPRWAAPSGSGCRLPRWTHSA